MEWDRYCRWAWHSTRGHQRVRASTLIPLARCPRCRSSRSRLDTRPNSRPRPLCCRRRTSLGPLQTHRCRLVDCIRTLRYNLRVDLDLLTDSGARAENEDPRLALLTVAESDLADLPQCQYSIRGVYATDHVSRTPPESVSSCGDSNRLCTNEPASKNAVPCESMLPAHQASVHRPLSVVSSTTTYSQCRRTTCRAERKPHRG